MVVRRALRMSSLAEAEDRSLLRDSKAAIGCSWSARDAMHERGLSCGVCLSLCVSVCHARELCQNE